MVKSDHRIKEFYLKKKKYQANVSISIIVRIGESIVKLFL